MKKLSILLSMVFMMASSLFVTTGLSSCTDEDSSLVIDNTTNGGNNDNGNTVSDKVITISNKTFTYTSNKASSLGGIRAVDGQSVAWTSADADLVCIWQSEYGYTIASPDAPFIDELAGYNSITSSGTNSTSIKLASGSISDYSSESALKGINISTSYINNSKSLGKGVNDLQSGDVILFQTSDGIKGALKFSNVSKVTKNFTVSTGYIYVPASAAISK